MTPIRPLLSVVFSTALAACVAVSGCSSSSSPAASTPTSPKDCVSGCEASGGAGTKVCGTDRVTYDGCAWDCDKVPSGVSIFPGACQADGSPAADAPQTAADGTVVCDYIKNGDVWQPVECAAGLEMLGDDGTTYLDGNDGTAFLSTTSLRGGGLHFLAMDPPAEVDHRARYGAIKNQGMASSCTAFAMTAALEGAIASSIGQKTPLSEMHLWSRYFSPDVNKCGAAAAKGGIATLEEANAGGLAYDETVAKSWEDKKSAPDAAVVSKVDMLGLFDIARVDAIGASGGKPTAVQMQKTLADGLDLFVAMYTSDNWGSANNGVIADYAVSGKGGHAVLVVGYKLVNGAPHFIVRNSWGPWADAGYGYVSFKTMEANVLLAFGVGIKRKVDAPTACPDGQSADLRGACRKVCDDKTLADEAGNCGPPQVTCAGGQTADASGACVVACKAGDTMSAGFKVSCTDRACSWLVDAGTGGCPAGGQPCTLTCPAPTCAVITKQNELKQTILACAAPNQ